MSSAVVSVEGVSKQYRLGQLHGGYQLLSERIAGGLRSFRRPLERRPSRQDFWALRDIGFEVAQGETFGIIGHNGAGKSTLLKILSRVTPPTQGEVRMRGRVGALLEVGTGFHPELTGRENIFLNGAILGMRRQEIQRRFDEIVEFAEVERFVDTPVKRYSSGMYLRLAFAVAAHLEPEILIVDEVLSVGDLAFQEKCLGRMEKVAGDGRTVLFVSHNLTAVRTLCSRALLLSGGQMVTEGSTDEVLETYVKAVQRDAETQLDQRTDRDGSGRLRLREVSYRSTGQIEVAVTGADLEILVRYSSADGRPLRGARFGIAIYTLTGGLMLHLESEVAGAELSELPPEGTVCCRIPRCPLPAGSYTVNLFSAIGPEIADWVQRATQLTVTEGDYYGTGRKPTEGHQAVLVEQDWGYIEAERPQVLPQGPG